MDPELIVTRVVKGFQIELLLRSDGEFTWRARKAGNLCKKWPGWVAEIGHTMTLAAEAVQLLNDRKSKPVQAVS